MSEQTAVLNRSMGSYDPVTQKMIQAIVNHINRSTGVVDGATLSISAQKTAFYVYCTPQERRVCHQHLLEIEEKGLLACSWHPQVLDDFETLKEITIPTGRAFLDKFGVQRLVDTVADSNIRLRGLRCGVDWIDHKIREISERWRVGAKYLLLGPKDIDLVEIAATVAQRIEGEPINGRDAYALSLDWFGNEKTIEEHLSVITLFCESRIPSWAKDLTEKEKLATLGILFDAPLFYFRGALTVKGKGFAITGNDHFSTASVLEAIDDVSIGGDPAYLMTIKNYRTFQRYVNAVHDDGIVIYVGDFPSRNFLALYEKIIEHLPSSTPIYHWSDVNLAGFREVVALQDCLFGREVQPFQMGVEALSHAPSDAENLDLPKLRKMAFSATKSLKTVLQELCALPAQQLKVVKQECMVLRPPAAHARKSADNVVEKPL